MINSGVNVIFGGSNLKANVDQSLMVLKGHTDFISSIALSADGSFAISGSRDGTMRIWNLKSGKCLKVLEGHKKCGIHIALSADESLVVSSHDSTLRLWDLKSGKCLKLLKGHAESTPAFTLSADGCFAVSGSYDKTLRVWNLESGQCLKVLKGHTNFVTSPSLSSDSSFAVSGSGDNTLRVWDLKTGRCLKILEGHTAPVISIAIKKDCKIAISGSWDETLRVWNLESGKCIKVLKGHTGRVSSIALSADDRLAVSGSWDGTLRTWNLESGECLKVLSSHRNRIFSPEFALSADSRFAVSSSHDSTLRVWNLESGRCLKVLEGHTGWISSVALSADGSFAVSGSSDNTLRVWSLARRHFPRKPTFSDTASNKAFAKLKKLLLSQKYDEIDQGISLLPAVPGSCDKLLEGIYLKTGVNAWINMGPKLSHCMISRCYDHVHDHLYIDFPAKITIDGEALLLDEIPKTDLFTGSDARRYALMCIINAAPDDCSIARTIREGLVGLVWNCSRQSLGNPIKFPPLDKFTSLKHLYFDLKNSHVHGTPTMPSTVKTLALQDCLFCAIKIPRTGATVL